MRAALAVMLLGACSILPSGGYDGAWQLRSGTLRGTAIEPAAGAPLTLTIDGSEANGSAGCNSYGGDVTIDGERMTFGDLYQTLIGCDAELAQAESLFMEALRATEHARRDGNRLNLTGDASELVFELVPPSPDVPSDG